MAIELQINVPNIGSIIATYDVIRVFRSTSTRDGPFIEVTAPAPQPASLLGNVVGPYTSLNGKTIIFRVATQNGTQPDIAVTFTDPNPVTALQAATAITAAAPLALLAVVDTGAVRVSTVAGGPSVKLTVVGGSGLADLGFGLYQSDVGEDPFIPLVANETAYKFTDPDGQDAFWYRWQFYNTISTATSAVTIAIQPQSATIDPVHKIEDARSTRGLTLIRGRDFTFRMAFWEDQSKQIPLIPFDAARYPAFVIYDPTGTTIQTGKAEIDGTVPNYKVAFTPAVDAMLTNDDRRWRIDWFMLTDSGRSVQASELFDLRDVDITETEIKEQKYLALENAKKRIRLALPNRPVSISVQLEDAENPTLTVLPLPAVFPPSGPNPSLTEAQDGDRYVYYYDVAPGLLTSGTDGKTYQAVWSVLRTPLADEDNIFQIIDVPPRQIFQYMQALRMGIDKFQKQANMLQAYQDSDIYEYLKRGAQLVNGMDPAHLTWSLTGIPGVVQPYWLLASMWWGLNAQQGLEIDLQFGFSGQSVTLDYEHASALEGYGAKMLDMLNTKFGPLKKQLYRRVSSVGSYSGRSLRRTGINNYVFQISHDAAPGGNNFLAILTQIGLI